MKKLVIMVIIFLVIPSIIFINQKRKFNELSQKIRQEVAETEETVNRVLNSNFDFRQKLPHIVDHLQTLLKKMETTGVLGIHVFDREERERLYRRFFEKLIDVRKQILESPGKKFSNEKKIKYMNALMMACNVLIHQSPATNDAEDSEKDIFAMWSRDLSQLVLSNNDIPEEEEEEIAPPEQNEWASLDIVDGKFVVPSVSERKFLTQETRTPVGLDRLKNYIGKEFEIRLKNGDTEEGTLLAVDARIIKLKVFLGSGRASMPIPINGIKKAEMITVEKRIALNQTKTIVKTDPWDEYKEMTVKRLEPVSDTTKNRGQWSYVNEGYVLITNDYKMYWVSDKSGRPVAHSPVTSENFKPLATGVEPGIIGRIGLVSSLKKKVSNFDWVSRPNKNAMKNFDPKNIDYRPSRHNTRTSEFKPFELRFKIRLVKDIPGIKKKVEIEEKDLVFNNKNTRIIVKADYVSQLVDEYQNGRYGEGDKPWEYEMIWGMNR